MTLCSQRRKVAPACESRAARRGRAGRTQGHCPMLAFLRAQYPLPRRPGSLLRRRHGRRHARRRISLSQTLQVVTRMRCHRWGTRRRRVRSCWGRSKSKPAIITVGRSRRAWARRWPPARSRSPCSTRPACVGAHLRRSGGRLDGHDSLPDGSLVRRPWAASAICMGARGCFRCDDSRPPRFAAEPGINVIAGTHRRARHPGHPAAAIPLSFGLVRERPSQGATWRRHRGDNRAGHGRCGVLLGGILVDHATWRAMSG